MPCRVDPLPENWSSISSKELKEIFARLEREKQESIQMMNDKIDAEISERHLEKLFFNSPMTVFLCKAMDIVVSNFDYKFVTADMEWWYKEHKYRDDHNGESLIDKKELAEKLIQLNKTYTVTK